MNARQHLATQLLHSCQVCLYFSEVCNAVKYKSLEVLTVHKFKVIKDVEKKDRHPFVILSFFMSL